MLKKFIKKAHIEFYKNPNEDGVRINCDIDFAISLHREDMIWIDEDSTAEKIPYLKATTKQLQELSDGWFVVISRTILWGDTLQITMEEAHDKTGFFKKKFSHLSEFTRQ